MYGSECGADHVTDSEPWHYHHHNGFEGIEGITGTSEHHHFHHHRHHHGHEDKVEIGKKRQIVGILVRLGLRLPDLLTPDVGPRYYN